MKAYFIDGNSMHLAGGGRMKLIGVLFTRLGGISRLVFVYRCHDGSIKTIPAGIGRKK